MTTMELEARKAMLVREILTDIDNEEALQKLQTFLHKLKKGKSHEMSITLLTDLMNKSEEEDKDGNSIDSEALEKEMQTW